MRGIVVGVERMGANHLRVLQAHPRADVVAVVDPDPKRRLAGVPAFESLADALHTVDADFVCVSTPQDVLASIADHALDAGLSVMVEKPMAARLAAARILHDKASRRRLLLAVGLVERCNPAVERLRTLLHQRTAGDVVHVHARRLGLVPECRPPVGVALDLATHDIDVMRFLTGSEIERAYAETVQADLLSGSLRFRNGVVGALETNWLSPFKVRQLSVTCENGLFVMDYLTQDLRLYQDDGVTFYSPPSLEPLAVQWDRFLNGAPAATGADGVAALRVACALQRSGVDHRPVRFRCAA